MFALLLTLVIVEAVLLLGLVTKLRKPEYDGNMVVHDSDTKTTFSLEVDTAPEQLMKQRAIVLKVVMADEE